MRRSGKQKIQNEVRPPIGGEYAEETSIAVLFSKNFCFCLPYEGRRTPLLASSLANPGHFPHPTRNNDQLTPQRVLQGSKQDWAGSCNPSEVKQGPKQCVGKRHWHAWQTPQLPGFPFPNTLVGVLHTASANHQSLEGHHCIPESPHRKSHLHVYNMNMLREFAPMEQGICLSPYTLRREQDAIAPTILFRVKDHSPKMQSKRTCPTLS